MRFACMSCGAKYSVPDGRLDAAGSGGLRVRCSRCRAIMVVSQSQGAIFADAETQLGSALAAASGRTLRAANEDDDTKKERRPAHLRRASGGGLGQELAAASPDVAMPAALSASGVYRPMPGVTRDVTGLFFSDLETLKREGKPVASRVWYAAIGNRPRGPYSASEVISLAQKGKVRESTLVWRPGFATWKRVKDGDAGTAEDLSWLRNIVSARLRREREAEERARARGIASLNLTRTSSGPVSSVHGSAVWSIPDMPPLPADDEDAAVADEGSSSGSASRWRPPELARTDGERLVPFQWRAEETASRAVGVRRSSDSYLWALALSAAAVVFAVIAVEAWRNGMLHEAVDVARGFLASLRQP